MSFDKIKAAINSPIRKNILANMFGIGVNLLNQIALVPFFLIIWGKDLYSDWIVISSLSLFFALTDIGFNSVVQNRFVISHSKQDYNECNSLLISDVIVISCVFLLSLIAACIFIFCFNITISLKLSVLSRDTASAVFVLLLLQIFINMYSGVPNSIFRAYQRNHHAVLLDQIGRLGVFAITLVGLICKMNIIVLAALLNVPLIAVLIIKFNIAYRLFKFQYPVSGLDYSLIKTVFIQGLGFLSFPAANAILLQGFTLVVNHYFGANSVVLYNTTRTMCNFVKTLLNTVLNSVWPEFSIAYGKKDIDRMRSLYNKSIRTSMICGFIICCGILLFGPIIYKLWTHGEVPFNYSLMTAFLVVLMVNTLWNTGSVALLATNNHIQFGIINVTITIIALCVAIAFAKLTHSLPYIVYSSLLIDLVLTGYVQHKFKLIIKATSSDSNQTDI